MICFKTHGSLFIFSLRFQIILWCTKPEWDANQRSAIRGREATHKTNLGALSAGPQHWIAHQLCRVPQCHPQPRNCAVLCQFRRKIVQSRCHLGHPRHRPFGSLLETWGNSAPNRARMTDFGWILNPLSTRFLLPLPRPRPGLLRRMQRSTDRVFTWKKD